MMFTNEILSVDIQIMQIGGLFITAVTNKIADW